MKTLIQKVQERHNFKHLEEIKEEENINDSYYSCIDCHWTGEISECDFDTEYDEFKGVNMKYPICPKCGGGLNC